MFAISGQLARGKGVFRPLGLALATVIALLATPLAEAWAADAATPLVRLYGPCAFLPTRLDRLAGPRELTPATNRTWISRKVGRPVKFRPSDGEEIRLRNCHDYLSLWVTDIEAVRNTVDTIYYSAMGGCFNAAVLSRRTPTTHANFDLDNTWPDIVARLDLHVIPGGYWRNLEYWSVTWLNHPTDEFEVSFYTEPPAILFTSGTLVIDFVPIAAGDLDGNGMAELLAGYGEVHPQGTGRFYGGVVIEAPYRVRQRGGESERGLLAGQSWYVMPPRWRG